MKEATLQFSTVSFIISMELKKNDYLAVGVMSGTSLDGLDIALSRYYICEGTWNFECIDCCLIEYDSKLRNTLRSIYQANALELVKIDIDFGRFIGKQVKKFIDSGKCKIDLIASHGQTIFHSPSEGYTKQIGSGAVIASITGLPVVSDFRQQDVTLGGQGAPLVPVGDALLFNQFAACLNLGGFANISYNKSNNRIAYDICAVNFVLNKLSRQIGFEFDSDGIMASRGKIIEPLLSDLNGVDFYKKLNPKSLGQEWVEAEIFPRLDKFTANDTENLLRTYSEHICIQISNVLELVEGNSILVTGGGARNKFIINRISELTTKKIIVPDRNIIDFKEAIIFGFLGVLRFRNEINCLASVTGAKKDSSSGAIYLA
jgi:anhydro-N-acetylmuramic acid kinase